MIRKLIYQWLETAHQRLPLPIKSLARGAISGGVAGFVLSLGYSMLFALPFLFILFMLFLSDVPARGIERIADGIFAVFWFASPLIVQYVLPSTAIGIAGGAITGLGVRFANHFISGSSFRASLASLFFWAPLTYFVSTRELPVRMLYHNWLWSDTFDFSVDLWLFIFVPSIIFVLAMAYVAQKSLSPFIRTAENV